MDSQDWLTREAVIAAGACASGVIRWHHEEAPLGDPRISGNKYAARAIGYGSEGYGNE